MSPREQDFEPDDGSEEEVPPCILNPAFKYVPAVATDITKGSAWRRARAARNTNDAN
jgi:hypothetical protein